MPIVEIWYLLENNFLDKMLNTVKPTAALDCSLRQAHQFNNSTGFVEHEAPGFFAKLLMLFLVDWCFCKNQ
jgi:hypothetical protein